MIDAEQEDFERRLAGLESMAVDAIGVAVDAIGSAHKSITDALRRHEMRLDNLEQLLPPQPSGSMDERLSKLEDAMVNAQLSREFNKNG